MPSAKNINNYNDVKAILDAAVAGGGGRYHLPTKGKAVHWRQRAYTFKNLAQRNAQATSTVPGYTPPTPYDELTFSLQAGAGDSFYVVIMIRQPEGHLETFEPLREAPKPLPPGDIPDDDLLLAAARALIKDKK